MVVAAVEFGEDVAQGLLQFFLCVGPHGERLVHGLAEPLNSIGRAGAEDFGVRLDGEELRQREIPLLEAEPTHGLAEVAVLDFVFCVARQLDRRRPAFFDAELSQEGPASWLQDPLELCDEAKGAEVEDHVFWQVLA